MLFGGSKKDEGGVRLVLKIQCYFKPDLCFESEFTGRKEGGCGRSGLGRIAQPIHWRNTRNPTRDYRYGERCGDFSPKAASVWFGVARGVTQLTESTHKRLDFDRCKSQQVVSGNPWGPSRLEKMECPALPVGIGTHPEFMKNLDKFNFAF
jgi:hypothetical protein